MHTMTTEENLGWLVSHDIYSSCKEQWDTYIGYEDKWCQPPYIIYIQVFFFQNHTDLLKLEFKHNDRKIIRVNCLIIAGAE